MNRKFVAKSNYVLRKVLNSEKSSDIVKNFIETFLMIKIENIKINPYLVSKEKYLPEESNFGIVDVRIKTEGGEELNVGIQIVDGYYVQNKLLLYYAQIHSNQLEYGEHRKVAKTITINILDFEYFKGEQYHKRIKIKTNNKENSVKETIELHTLELPKFKIKIGNQLEEEEEWMSYLTGRNVLVKSINIKNPIISKLNYLLEEYWKNEKME